jgi:hypothetical protein
MATRPFANTTLSPHSKRGESTPMMASRHDIEFARLSMLKARRALEVYETIMGFAWSREQTRLNQGFTSAIGTYLMLLASRR